MIKLILLIIITIAALSYFGISIRSVVESGSFQDNFSFVWNWAGYLWDNYLAGPARYLWYDIFIDLLWDSFVDNMERIKDGKPTEMMENAPQSDFR